MTPTAPRMIWRWWLRLSFIGITIVVAYVVISSLIFRDWWSLAIGAVGCLMVANGVALWRRGDL